MSLVNKDNKSANKNRTGVTFGTVTVRNYGMILGTNPATSIGSPVCLEWEYHYQDNKTKTKTDNNNNNNSNNNNTISISVDEYEISKNFGRIQIKLSNGKIKNRSPKEFYLSYYKRRGILERAGYTQNDFTTVERQIKYERFRRKISVYQSFPLLYMKSWKITNARRKCHKFVRKYRIEQEKQEKQQQKQKK
jgi:hypothetical protein